MKKYLSLFTVLLISAVALGAKIGDDELVVGKPGSVADKTIKMGTQKIRSNQSSQKLEFTNDGTNYKAFGSGSGGGGGVDYLQDLNGDFEGGTTGWTASGGTFTAISSGQIAGSISGQWDPSATAQTFQSSLITKLAGANGRSCSASFEYNWNGTLGHYLAEVIDQTNAVIATSILNPTTSTGTLLSQLPLFDCDAATQFRIRLTTTADATAIKIDSAFIGYGRNSQQISQAEIFGQISAFPTVASSSTSATFVNVVLTSPSYTTNGKASAPAGNLAAVTFASMPPGKYEIISTYHLGVTGQTTDTQCFGRIFDGTTAGDVGQTETFSIRINGDVSSNGQNEVTSTAVFSFSTTQTNKTFALQVRRSVGNGSCSFGNAQIVVKYYPLNANQAVNFETSGWRVDALITGTADIALRTVVGTALDQQAQNANLNLVSNPGSLPAQIPCQTGLASSGLTCTGGDEQVGVVFDLPAAGTAQVCAGFTHYTNIPTNTNVTARWNLVETDNTTQTILQTTSKVESSLQFAAMRGALPVRVCGLFNFATAGKKTIRLRRDDIITVQNATENFLMVNQVDRGFSIQIIPVNQGFPTPVFTDLQNSLRNRVASSDTSQVVLYSTTVTNNGSVCAGANTIGGAWVSSYSRGGTGLCTVNFASGFFNGVDVPVCTAINNSSFYELKLNAQTPTQIIVSTATSTGTAADSNFNIVCTGKK